MPPSRQHNGAANSDETNNNETLPKINIKSEIYKNSVKILYIK